MATTKKIVNLTPHAVLILRDNPEGEITGFTGTGPAAKEGKFSLVAEFKPAGPVARALQADKPSGELEINGTKVPLIRTCFGETTDLPEASDGVLIVVSLITAQAAKAAGRDTSDLLVTSDLVRDSAGKPIGVRKFALI